MMPRPEQFEAMDDMGGIDSNVVRLPVPTRPVVHELEQHVQPIPRTAGRRAWARALWSLAAFCAMVAVLAWIESP